MKKFIIYLLTIIIVAASTHILTMQNLNINIIDNILEVEIFGQIWEYNIT